MPLPECCSRDRAYLERTCRASVQAIPMPDHVILARVLQDFLMYCDALDRTISPHLCTGAVWEPWVTLAMARSITEGMYVLDCGANHGYYSLLAGLIASGSGHVCAVEPNPRLADLCRWTLEVNGLQRHCAVVQAAVGATDQETATLVLDTFRGCNSSIVRAARPGDSVVDVPLVTIDALTADWPRVDLVKMDVEGGEEDAWLGMQATIRRHPRLCLILEVNTARSKDPEGFYQDLAAVFPLRYIDGEGRTRQTTVEQLMTEHIDEDWMLWLKRGPGL